MTVHGDIERDLSALPEVKRLVDAFFSSAQARSEVRFAVELAIEEIFTNMVRHNRHGAGGIRIEISSSGPDVVATITDSDSPRFDPFTDVPAVDVARPIGQRQPGGLGVHLVRKMMDGIEYSHVDRTSTITLRKRMT